MSIPAVASNLADLLGGQKFDLPNFICGNSLFDCGPIEDIQIARLGILAHGSPGAVDIDAVAGCPNILAGFTDPMLMNEMTLPRYAPDFAKMRSSDIEIAVVRFATRYYQTLAAWNDLSVLPWASETSLHAIMAYKGVILKSGVGAHLP